MSSNKRWDTDEKIKLMKAFSEGKTYDDIGKILNRSANAIKLRLESIVYDNLTNGKPMNVLTRMLHTEPDTIKQLYYSHKSFLQARGEEVVDVDFSKNTTQDAQKLLKSQHGLPIQLVEQAKSLHLAPKPSTLSNPGIGSMSGGVTSTFIDSKDSKVEKKLEKLQKENYAMEQIIKNYKMKRQLRKLYMGDKLDEKSVIICDRILKQPE